MSDKSEAETRLALYLLGDVSSSEQELLEAEYFSDDEAFQKMLSAEDDLIDAYARGELSAEHRRLFERRFLNSGDGRERLRFARSLAGAVAESPAVAEARGVVKARAVSHADEVAVASQPLVSTPHVLNAQPGFWATLWSRSPALSFAVVTLAVLLIGGNAALLVERRSMRNEMEALRKTVESEQARNNESAAQVKSLQEQLAQANEHSSERSPGSKSPDDKDNVAPELSDPRLRDTIAENRIPEFTVYPGGVRGSSGSGNRFTIPKAQRSISLKLVIENPAAAQSYRASIETADGAQLKSFNSLKPTSSNLIHLPRVPASELPSGVYIISLHAHQPDGTLRKIGDYTFNVVRK